MSTIPASRIVNVTPNVLAAGGSAIDLSGMFLTNNPRVPIGTFISFNSQAAVAAYFGAASLEAARAVNYFAGFDGSTVKPGSMLFTQFNTAPVSAYVRGGNLSSMTLAQLQAFNSLFSVTIDGVLKTGTVNLAAATSFSSAATLIADQLDIEGAQTATFTGSITTTVLTVTAMTTGVLAVGQFVRGGTTAVGTYITSLGTGTGGVGTYNVSTSQTVVSGALNSEVPGVSFDSIASAFIVTSGTTGLTSTVTFPSGALATSLLLTQALGAVQSIGAIAAVPATFMAALIQQTQNWATFTTTFDPDGSGNANKLLFAQWVSGTNFRYAYICWDTDPNPTTQNPSSTSLGALIAAAGLQGTSLWWTPSDLGLAAFICGAVASINFNQLNGRATLAFKSQSILLATVTTDTAASNLIANGYNYYGAYATANTGFVFAYPGSVSGKFLWLDSYINQIWLNNNFQLDLIQLLNSVPSIPYNAEGKALIETSILTTVQQGLNFGAFRPGVTLSASQIAAVNAAAGVQIDQTLSARGWYFQVQDASPTVRQARQSPPCNFWYMDGEAVQQINLTSVDVL